MFRVSPWITYDPAPDVRIENLTRTNTHFYNMPEDVEMDAPQISTLKDEDTPEPQPPARQGKFRVKLLMGEGKSKRAASASSSPAHKPTAHAGESDEEEDDDDDEEEEDQLIDDDDDDDDTKSTILPGPPVSSPEKRGSVTKRGSSTPRGGRGRGGGKRKGRSDATSAVITIPVLEGADSANSTPATSISAPVTGRKRGAPKGVTGQRAPRKRAPKTPKTIPSHLREDAGSISETYAATAASSPPAHDDHSPEPSEAPVLSHTISIAPAPMSDDMNLDGVPLPAYPLPSKPFPVHPPVKIGSGFAPIIPVDKSGKKARHWRQANREIRGIAGGRWFTKSWIGDKESEFATANAAAQAAALHSTTQAISERENISGLPTVALPKLAGMSISGRGPGRPRIHPKVESNLATNPSSRAQSTVSDTIPFSAKKRTHTQMSSTVDTPAVSTPVP